MDVDTEPNPEVSGRIPSASMVVEPAVPMCQVKRPPRTAPPGWKGKRRATTSTPSSAAPQSAAQARTAHHLRGIDDPRLHEIHVLASGRVDVGPSEGTRGRVPPGTSPDPPIA
jgi:hypothetical protein